MTSRDFVFWLQGYLEISKVDKTAVPMLTADQLECVQKHLALVFAHEIDPSAGPPKHQQKLDALHATPSGLHPDLKVRC